MILAKVTKLYYQIIHHILPTGASLDVKALDTNLTGTDDFIIFKYVAFEKQNYLLYQSTCIPDLVYR